MVSPKSNDRCPYERKAGDIGEIQTRGEGPVTTGAGMIGVMSLQAKELLAASRSRRVIERILPEGGQPAVTLISDSWPTEL